MLYHYVAVDKSGKTMEGDFEAGTLNDVLYHLSGKGFRPLSVAPMKKTGLGTRRFWGGINISDKVFLVKYLSLMLRVGTDLLSAINILITDFEKPAMKEFLLEVRDNLDRGQPFYESFAKHPETFPPTFINLVKAAEASGNLEKTFEDLSTSLERESELRSHIRAALVYPIVVFLMALGIMTFLVTFALPKIANVFSNTGTAPPLFSQIVFGVGLFIGGNIIPIYLAAFIILGGTALFVSKTEVGKRFMNRVVTKLPFIKKIYNDLAIQRMSSTVSSLMRAGLPIVDTIMIAADTVGHGDFQVALRRVAEEGLAKGLTIGDSFKRESIFPKSVSNIVAISEKTGHLDEVLATLAEFYGANIDSRIKALVSLLEPLLLLSMGVIVAVIALSIIVPIYQLTSSF